ncbi:heat shock protein HtpX [Methanococcoides vulcani]|uniref:Heat shock protein HtpX n=1 Tax=Methanococcoides vulcani TaxID=1353158 RepID=A0A1I0B1C4_9EURY|nr:M48 family metalloprotease [Methanococcoides vulcani]SET00270.1 heat shock protein HtpX [Methanococcoides vulcani]
MLSILVSALAFFISGLFAAEIVLVMSIWISYGLYRYSGKLLLKWYRAEKVGVLKKLSEKAGISTVGMYNFNSPIPLIFTVGTGPEYNVALSTGAMGIFGVAEIEALLAREIGHIRNGDVPINTITALFAGTLVGASSVAFHLSLMAVFGKENNPIPKLIYFFIMGLIALPAALLVQLMISSSREYAADEVVEEITGRPNLLPEMLKRLESQIESFHRQINPGHAHLFPVNFLYIKDAYDVYLSMFNTHPNIDKRIDNLIKKGE